MKKNIAHLEKGDFPNKWLANSVCAKKKYSLLHYILSAMQHIHF